MTGVDRSFGSRLRRLRGQADSLVPPAANRAESGPDPEGTSSALAAPPLRQPSFAERVQRLMIGPSALRQCAPDEAALREALGATCLAPGVLLIDRWLDIRHRHGRVFLPKPGSDLAALVADLPGLVDPSAEQDGRTDAPDVGQAPIVCLDTETSGLAGGTGTWAFVTGLLSADGDGWRLRQYLLTQLDAEADYLAAIRNALTGARLLLSYNGRTFDAPLLATRFRLAGQPDPLPSLAHLDLLASVRRAFGRVWPDCRLSSAEAHLLGFVREGDLPGAAAPAAWLGWLRQGEISPLTAVLRHNRWDLLSLAGLAPTLAQVFREPETVGADVRAVAAHHRARGRLEEAIRILETDRHRLSPGGLLDLALLYRRHGNWAMASKIWERLVVAGDLDARAALAKYHEHQTRDVARALALAAGLPAGPERERRCERLRSKLMRRGEDVCPGV
jgi:uncharacterized protein